MIRQRTMCMADVSKGAYVLEDAPNPKVVLIGTGSEVWPAVEAAKIARGRTASRRAWSASQAGRSSKSRRRSTRPACCRRAFRNWPSRRELRWAGGNMWARMATSSASIALALRRRAKSAGRAGLYRGECGGQGQGAGEVSSQLRCVSWPQSAHVFADVHDQMPEVARKLTTTSADKLG